MANEFQHQTINCYDDKISLKPICFFSQTTAEKPEKIGKKNVDKLVVSVVVALALFTSNVAVAKSKKSFFIHSFIHSLFMSCLSGKKTARNAKPHSSLMHL